MESIRAMPWNGFNAISTFSGGGGSSTGYRMAGFRVLWASEFIDAARDTYRANMAPHTTLDGRDIRQVKGSDILDAIKMQPGELDLFDGSPPCASFSTAGKRESGWGKVKKYSDKAQRTDDLFFEFVRLIREVKPKTFVAENVSGLVKGTAKGYFLEILKALKESGYKVTCKVLDAKWLGVPQSRQRTIFVGVREDLQVEPSHPKPLPYCYSVRDALPGIFKVIQDPKGQFAIQEAGASPCFTIKAGSSSHCKVEAKSDIRRYEMLPPSRQKTGAFNLVDVNPAKPCGTVTVSSPGNDLAVPIAGRTEKRKFTIAELKRICGFPDDYVLTGTYAQQWERCGRAVPPVMMMHIAAAIRDNVLARIK
jgi:DNA (cytosine-5)-methyltransferase 1